ncbi:MAG TPA: LCP family protein [Thermoleophilaceae bacterium]|nr:LCP family protein [Thermoleophilaceae bacterium]
MFEEIPRPGLWKKLLIGAALVVFASAGATAVAGFHEVDKVVDALELSPELDLPGLADTDPGEPQTLMILGSDRRPKNNVEGGAGARSDTIMLVRLNPDKDATALMSLPRDLKVQIPGHGTDKINAAYDLGGPRLTLKTVKQLTGLSINHVINVSFGGFWRAVNAIGCVYADVDRRYFNDNPEFAPIDVQPGYQRLCARKALQYVRFRHEDNDLVRSARQQDFLRQTKQQVNYTELISKRDRLVKIFGRNTTTDTGLHSRAEVLRLMKLAVFSAGRPIREIHFEGLIGPSYVEASDERVKKLVQEFLQLEGTPGPRGELKDKARKRKRRPPSPGDVGLEDAFGFGRDQALQAVQQGLGKTLPVLFPRLRTSGSLYAGPPRVYKLRANGRTHASYRMVLNRALGVGEYYGLQGTTWKDPPILEEATETRKVGRREYELHYDGDRLRLVAWRTDKGAYWVSNTLLQSLTEGQMMGIARSARGL